jgi:hypothetical protein
VASQLRSPSDRPDHKCQGQAPLGAGRLQEIGLRLGLELAALPVGAAHLNSLGTLSLYTGHQVFTQGSLSVSSDCRPNLRVLGLECGPTRWLPAGHESTRIRRHPSSSRADVLHPSGTTVSARRASSQERSATPGRESTRQSTAVGAVLCKLAYVVERADGQPLARRRYKGPAPRQAGGLQSPVVDADRTQPGRRAMEPSGGPRARSFRGDLVPHLRSEQTRRRTRAGPTEIRVPAFQARQAAARLRLHGPCVRRVEQVNTTTNPEVPVYTWTALDIMTLAVYIVHDAFRSMRPERSDARPRQAETLGGRK